MLKNKKIFALIGVILIMLFMLVGCSCGCDDKTVKLDLPEGVSLVDEELDADKLNINSDVEFLITAPEGKELDKLFINNEDKTSIVSDNKFTI